MIKKAFIIGAPLSYEQPVFHNGVLIDVRSLVNYFASPTGGAFDRRNIITMINPSWNDIKLTLWSEPADFAELVFSGHGYQHVPSKKTVLNINSYEAVSLGRVISNIRAPKKLVIADTCRSYREDENFFAMGGPVGQTVMAFPSYLTHDHASRLHDYAIRKAPTGTQIIYSSAPGEKSSITSQGSDFSRSLLSSVKEWASVIEERSILLGIGAKTHSTGKLRRDFGWKQTPQVRSSSMYANYPFAVRLGTELL